jgi:hypothetical protein
MIERERHQIFDEIDKFDRWVKEKYGDTPQDKLFGEWEDDYGEWQAIYLSFEDFLRSDNPQEWTRKEKDRLLYIIARNNETEELAEALNEEALKVLTKQAFDCAHKNAKWQLAIQLDKLADRGLALEFLERFVNDKDEYVIRRALLEMAKIGSKKTEFYCEKLWHKDIFGESEEYQRIAIIHSLHEIKSPKLAEYIKLAKDDGRKYLFKNALEIEAKLSAL